MYEKNGYFGEVDFFFHEPEPMGKFLISISLMGWHKCNSLYRVTRSKADHSCADYYLMLHTVSGKGILHYHGKQYALTENTAAIIDCRVPHQYYTAPGEVWEFYFIHFNQETIGETYRILVEKDSFLVMLSQSLLIRHSMRSIIDLNKRHGKGIDVQASSLLSIILHAMLEDAQGRMRATPLIEEILGHLHTHYAEKIELQEIANQFFINKNYLCSLFKRDLGDTLYNVLTKIRIAESKKLLLGTMLPLADIAHACGFSTPNNFITTFKRLEGTTPHVFRKSMRQKHRDLLHF